MKYLYHLLIVVLILPFSTLASDIYYCVDDAVTGFNPKENFAIRRYKPEKFKIMIDFDEGMVQSQELFFAIWNDPKCTGSPEDLSCINAIGNSIVFSFNKANPSNKANLRYYRSVMFDPGNPSDDVLLAYGSCEKF